MEGDRDFPHETAQGGDEGLDSGPPGGATGMCVWALLVSCVAWSTFLSVKQGWDGPVWPDLQD